jgi:hypothetical protein
MEKRWTLFARTCGVLGAVSSLAGCAGEPAAEEDVSYGDEHDHGGGRNRRSSGWAARERSVLKHLNPSQARRRRFGGRSGRSTLTGRFE